MLLRASIAMGIFKSRMKVEKKNPSSLVHPVKNGYTWVLVMSYD